MSDDDRWADPVPMSDGVPKGPDPASPTHCPTCTAPSPNVHPAMNYGGEVQPCGDPWHGVPVAKDVLQIKALHAAAERYRRERDEALEDLLIEREDLRIERLATDALIGLDAKYPGISAADSVRLLTRERDEARDEMKRLNSELGKQHAECEHLLEAASLAASNMELADEVERLRETLRSVKKSLIMGAGNGPVIDLIRERHPEPAK